MGVFDSFRRKREPEAEYPSHQGYYALHDGLDYDDWDDRLDQVDDAFRLEEKRRQRWWQRDYWRDRRKRWWAVRVVAAFIGLFIVLVAWLAITAPLNKSLQPIAAPQVTLLAADGTPIARNGAITDVEKAASQETLSSLAAAC